MGHTLPRYEAARRRVAEGRWSPAKGAAAYEAAVAQLADVGDGAGKALLHLRAVELEAGAAPDGDDVSIIRRHVPDQAWSLAEAYRTGKPLAPEAKVPKAPARLPDDPGLALSMRDGVKRDNEPRQPAPRGAALSGFARALATGEKEPEVRRRYVEAGRDQDLKQALRGGPGYLPPGSPFGAAYLDALPDGMSENDAPYFADSEN